MVESLEPALDPVIEALEEMQIDRKVAYKIRLALDELLTNVILYAYDGNPDGEVEIRFEITDEPRRVSITLIDEGKPFDPLKIDEPSLSSDINERKIGGLGVFIARKTMDEIEYHRENNQNILTIRKNI